MHRAHLAGIVVILLSSTAFAETDPESKAAAETLFRDGKTAFDAGNFAVACPKLEGALALTGGEALGGALLLGHCYEKQGKLASAWGLYTEVAGKAGVTGQAERAAQAASGAAALLPRLHYVALRVPDSIVSLPGAEIRRQGKSLRRELWASRFPVDPGQFTLEISAPGKRPFRQTVPIPAAPGDTAVAVEPLVDEAAVATPPVAALPAPLDAPKAPPAVAAATPWSGPRVAGVVIAAAGLVGVGVGVGLAAVAKGRYNDALADPKNCSALPAGGRACADLGPINDARGLGNVATATFFAGAGAALGGGLLILLAPSRARESANLPGLTGGKDGAAITWKGAF
jgi:hypothetical protein